MNASDNVPYCDTKPFPVLRNGIILNSRDVCPRIYPKTGVSWGHLHAIQMKIMKDGWHQEIGFKFRATSYYSLAQHQGRADRVT